MSTVLITGSSSGIGRSSVEYFQKKGWKVAATMRSPEKETELQTLEGVEVIRLDVTDRASISSAIQQTLDAFGGLDVVVNNAGYGLAGPMEAVKPEQLERQYATNVFGPVYVMQAALPHFREQGRGLFINISSVGGRITLPFNSLYHGAKFALEGISESINYELNPFGIRVKLVEPGGVKTDFAGRSLDLISDPDITAYNDMLQKIIAAFTSPERQAGYSSGDDIAAVIYEAATDNKNQVRYAAGNDAIQLLGARDTMSDEDFLGMIKKEFGV